MPAGRGDRRLAVAVVLVSAAILTLLATLGQNSLPVIMRGNHYTPMQTVVISSTWMLSLLAQGVLWWRRPHAVLDLWLIVVMCAWSFDIALGGVLNAGGSTSASMPVASMGCWPPPLS